MNSLNLFLEPNYEKYSDSIPDRIKEFFKTKDSFFMKHQIDTYNANKEYDIVFNTYPTGTGKTRASLLHILDKPFDNVLFIAPTNELISQHCKDIKNFIQKTGLSHNIIEINAKIIQNILKESEITRKGELLYRLLANPLSEEFIEKLNLASEKIDYTAPFILVTNPDIFYYAITFGYNNNDKRNIFHSFFTQFNYIVVDEFHYYNPKQLCCFLFFFTLSLKFGYFKDGKRKITLLTATPSSQVLGYFERLKDEGIRYLILEPEKVSPEEKNAVRTLSKIKLSFYSLEDKSENKFSKNIEKLKDYILEKGKANFDGAIISNSLININDCKTVLKNYNITNFREITGIVDKEDRAKYKDSNLILATPTVDIGYNFDRDKERQNIDYLIFDFRYEDQFWQRLGRAGRILGKQEQDFLSEVIVFIPNDLLAILKTSFEENKTIYRNELMLFTKKHFSQRDDFYNYISFYGISEMSKPIENLKAIFPKDKESIITEDLFEAVSKVFTGKTRSYFHSIQKFSKRYTSLEIAQKDTNKTSQEIVNEFSNLFTRNDRKELIAKESLENFIKEEYFFIKGLYNFREAFQGITALIYDPNKIMSSNSEKVFSYDLFHLLKYYELEFYSSKSEFIKELPIEVNYNDESLFCKIISRLENNRSISFFHDSNLDKDFFEERYLNKITSKNNIDFNLYLNKEACKEKITSDLRLIKTKKTFKEIYIPCLIIDYRFLSDCIKNNIFPIDFEVTFSNGFNKKYSIILGTNAYLLASKPKFRFLSDYMDKKTSFYIC